MVGVFKVRDAELSDLDFILGELKEFAKFYNSKHSLFGSDDNYNIHIIKRLINEHLFLVCEHDQHGPVGFISGTVASHFLNPDVVCLSEVFWWVKPEHRMSRAGVLLLNKYIEFAEQKCDWVTITIEDGSPINDKSLIKRGFKLKEKSFLMEF
jgi:N-acetylglutamate synthase-like GNAT family acetyltransferase